MQNYFSFSFFLSNALNSQKIKSLWLSLENATVYSYFIITQPCSFSVSFRSQLRSIQIKTKKSTNPGRIKNYMSSKFSRWKASVSQSEIRENSEETKNPKTSKNSWTRVEDYDIWTKLSTLWGVNQSSLFILNKKYDNLPIKNFEMN